MPASSAAALVSELIAASTESLVRASGTVSMCTFTKSGLAAPSVKHAEGQRAALKELRARLHTPPSKTADAFAIAAELAADWRAELARAESREMGPDWIAYRAGGTTALDRAATLLSGATGGEPG